MEVLSFPSPDAIGMKREEEKKRTTFWSRVVLIAIAVLFVGMFIFTYYSSVIAGALRTVKPLETVELSYTIRDDYGIPIITTDKEIFDAAYQKGIPVFYTKPLPMTAGKTGSPDITLVPPYSPAYGTKNFALFPQEYDEMSVGLVGMHAREIRTIPFTFNDSYEQSYTAEFLESQGENFSSLAIGDRWIFGISTTPVVVMEGEELPEELALRTSIVVEKTDENATFRSRYATADVSFAEFPR